jgi:hypothetical protein
MTTRAEPDHAGPGSQAPRLPGAAANLGRMLRGRVYEPGDDGYDDSRQARNPHVDPRPALVAEPCGPADVRAALAARG